MVRLGAALWKETGEIVTTKGNDRRDYKDVSKDVRFALNPRAALAWVRAPSMDS